MPAMDFPNSPINGQTTTDGRYYFDSSVGSTGAWRSTPLPVGGLPAGSIMAWGTNTPPANWLLADGSAVSRSVYSSLFAVIGTQYGAGDGTTTFNLPDLRGRVPVGRNGGTFGTLGATGGAETHTLSVNEMPSHNHGGATNTTGAHTHSIAARAYAWESFNWEGYVAANRSSGQSLVYPNTNSAGDHSHTISSQGGGQAHNNLQPYQVVNYIIKFSAGWTAGDSELATRLGVVEQRQILSPNYLINGAFDIWQRGAGPWNTNNAYTADRWQLNSTINAVRSTDTPNSNFLYSLEYSNTGVQTWCSIRQLIEASNAKHLVGKKVTISFWVKRVSSGGSSMVVEMGHASSTDNFSTITGLPTLTSPVAPSSSWQYMSVTSDVLPAGVANGLYVGFTLANPTNVQMNVRLAGVQLEEGTVATPFRRNAATIQAELSSCQRYFQAIGGTGNSAKIGWGNIYNGTTGVVTVKTLQTMRTSPSFSYSGSLSNYSLHVPGIAISNVSSISMDNSSPDAATFTVTGGSGFTGGHACVIQSNVVGAALWLSAEL